MRNIQQALKILRQGGLVAIPTETVYGLAADATNPAAIKKIFKVKKRPLQHPLIVHIGDIKLLDQWAIEISESARRLAKKFWPGPLTLIFKKHPSVLDLVTGQQNTVGIRMPRHVLTQKLLKKFGGGVAAPSANRFGKVSPTSASAVREELGNEVDGILEGGQCEVGIESTIVDVSGDKIRILRPGMITAKQIENALRKPLSKNKKNSPRVSGSLKSHYAPQTPVRVIASRDIPKFLKKLPKGCFPVAMLTRNKIFDLSCTQIKMPKNPQQYAHDLYQTLRNLDKKKFGLIIIEAVPENSKWLAIKDRLQRMELLPLRQRKP